jgi:ABC-type nitrate/sulfonate/bicarbonate transport system ATPase subunit
MLELAGVAKTFETRRGEAVVALAPVSLAIARGTFLAILGPSGCGKSTIFNIIAGLEMPSAGSVTLDGASILGMSGVVSYMLQKDLLLPWRSIIDNVVLGMEIDGVPRSEARSRALPLLARY